MYRERFYRLSPSHTNFQSTLVRWKNQPTRQTYWVLGFAPAIQRGWSLAPAMRRRKSFLSEWVRDRREIVEVQSSVSNLKVVEYVNGTKAKGEAPVVWLQNRAKCGSQRSSWNVFPGEDSNQILVGNDQSFWIRLPNDQQCSGSKGWQYCRVGILTVTTAEGNEVERLSDGNACLFHGDVAS